MILRTIGVIVIALLLIIIVFRFLFSEKFRKDLRPSKGKESKGGESKASLFGIVSVKGAHIVVLIVIFTGALVYLIDIDVKKTAENVTIEQAIKYMKENDSVAYSINADTEDDRKLMIYANKVHMGELTQKPDRKLTATKSSRKDNKWYIGILKSTLGHVTAEGQGGYLEWNEDDPAYRVKEHYKLQNLKLYFRIDSITKYVEKKVTKYRYHVAFGEGENVNNINWRDIAEKFTKSQDGMISPSNEFNYISKPGWSYQYFVKFGFGQPSTAEPILASVEKLNAIAIGMKIE